MPTDNPKISLYVPQQIYDRFKEFQKEQDLSMSQAGIVILAEYFGLKETIKEITEGTTVGGVTLSEFSWLKEKVLEIEELVKTQDLNQSQVSEMSATERTSRGNEETLLPVSSRKNKPVEQLESTSKSLIEDKVIVDIKQDKDKEIQASNPQLELLSEPQQEIHPFTAKLLGQRFGMGKTAVPVYKSKNSPKKFQEWTKEKDPDYITWIPNPEGKGYIPKDELASELKSKLLKWVEDNS